MRVTIEVTLDGAEEKALAAILNCDKGELGTFLSKYARAALEEYVRMFLGEKIFKRGSDFLEYRLFLLIRHAFDGTLPNDSRISALFQTTASQSRALLRSVMSKYQYPLDPAIRKTLADAIRSAKWDRGNKVFVFTPHSSIIVDALNRVLADLDGTLTEVAKQSGSIGNYIIPRASQKQLCKTFGVTYDEKDT